MSLMDHLLVRPIVIVRATETSTDRYGNATPDWTQAERIDCRGWVAQISAIELATTRESVDAVLFLTPDVELSAFDRVEIDGEIYEVTGTPTQAWRALPPPALHHIEAQLRRVEG
jgi:hypothetical protein